ncbi:MAG: hypothetical protein RR633_20380 [Acinetobacter sp.]
MKPCSFRSGKSGNFLQDFGFGNKNTAGSIKGSAKKLGENYQNASIAIFNKANLQLITVRMPDSNGNYQIHGLNNSISCFVIGFDNKKQYNAVIQDNVVPK